MHYTAKFLSMNTHTWQALYLTKEKSSFFGNDTPNFTKLQRINSLHSDVSIPINDNQISRKT